MDRDKYREIKKHFDDIDSEIKNKPELREELWRLFARIIEAIW